MIRPGLGAMTFQVWTSAIGPYGGADFCLSGPTWVRGPQDRSRGTAADEAHCRLDQCRSCHGGEALKALQYVQELLAQGHDVELITHARCREGLVGLLPKERVRYVEDSAAMRTCWRVPGLRRLINGLFHREVARMIRGYDRDDVVVQYLCPISPVEPRFPPKGYRCVIGPVSGNIFYPDGFRHLDGIGARLRGRAYRPVQRMLGLALRQYKQVDRVLVSGYARTKEALRWAGCPEDKMQSVWDAGLSAELITGPRMDPQAAPRDFCGLAGWNPTRAATWRSGPWP